jgi:hypothetical protein
MNSRVVVGALVVSAAAFALGACIFTIDYITCKSSEVGVVCREPRNMAAATWGALATNALALATNVAKEASSASRNASRAHRESV